MSHLRLLVLAACSVVVSAQSDPKPPAPPSEEAVQAAIRDGVGLLMARQETYTPDPSVRPFRTEELLRAWQAKEIERLTAARTEAKGTASEWPYEGVYRVGGTIPPGYRVGGSAIVCRALLEAPEFAKDAQRKAAVGRSLDFMVAELEKNDLLAPVPQTTYDVRAWGHIYALDLFLRAGDHQAVPPALAPRIRRLIPHLLAGLKTGQVTGGGWNYAGRGVSPFMTGPALLTLYEAAKRGHDVDVGVVENALKVLEAGRVDNGAFAYSGAARGAVEMPGSSARSAVAELALFQAGRGSVDRLRTAVDGFFAGWDDLLKRKSQQGTHEGPYAIAPYYFFFGHTYAGIAIESLPEAERAAYRGKLREVLWRTREADGSWNDRIFPRSASYSTAMVVLALSAPKLPALAEWKTPAKSQ